MDHTIINLQNKDYGTPYYGGPLLDFWDLIFKILHL